MRSVFGIRIKRIKTRLYFQIRTFYTSLVLFSTYASRSDGEFNKKQIGVNLFSLQLFCVNE